MWWPSLLLLFPAGIVLWEALSVAIKTRRAELQFRMIPPHPPIDDLPALQIWAHTVLSHLPGKRGAVFAAFAEGQNRLCARGGRLIEALHTGAYERGVEAKQSGTLHPPSLRTYIVTGDALRVAFETELPLSPKSLQRLAGRLSRERASGSTPQAIPSRYDPPEKNSILAGARAHRIAHDMRIPLAALSASREALQSLSLAGAAQDIVQRMGRQIEFLEAMTHDVVRTETGRGTNSETRGDVDESADVGRTVRSILDTLKDQIDRKQISVKERVPHTACVRITEINLKRILYNLTTNALRHCPQKGKVEIRADKDTDHWRIEVTDSGPGIAFPPEVFFLMAAQGVGRTGGGFGIGLVSARALAADAGGDLMALPAKKGARFLLVLPAVPDTAVPADDTPKEHNWPPEWAVRPV